ncbi:anhydro-N-acetylmuramic acid kinase [Tistlia consotensis]|uniref:Anhydro-N-acetylmuramic acid kinase n=1 Tax=Tistlia consotensis USBA 355 TaxID=560819 RepID=A0A1Y6C2W6_9PROT|nr:anhydro-N-acetylmuramic acid kinase [Tistlia consotensis]SMF41017.1 anhydro-N-acetylmuramic acid kinase [Tistlia consotensis USBA 355]SNR74194.1 anhydro-N-acetylmuramic acid kinase [Tistlia consotensis]
MVLAVGLMSGTSLDGIDAALIETDGLTRVEPQAFLSEAYDEAFRPRLRGLLGGKAAAAEVAAVEAELTDRHAVLVRRLLAAAGRRPSEIAVVGFHGQTILHEPERRRTWQIGDGQRLAEQLGIEVVADFRSADVAAGGEGAPFAPLYHAARATGLERPLAVLNLGGVGNVTWIGAAGGQDLLAFDTGPANALIDDWVARRAGLSCDLDGRLAAAGTVERGILVRLLDHPYFGRRPPKSLDRDAWDVSLLEGLSTEDGAATLTAFTAASVAAALPLLPEAPRRWLVTGGGRRNPVLLQALRDALGAIVEPVEAAGWNGDAVEAEAFAYLAVRSLEGLPLSLPGTTGVPAPQTGGRRFRPRRAA